MHSVRLRLLVLALLPLVVLMPLLLGATMLHWIHKFNDLLIAKVASDLRVAEQYLNRLHDTQATQIAAIGRSVRFAEAQAQGPAAVRALLAEREAGLPMDFITYGPIPEAAAAVAAQAPPGGTSAALAIFTAEELAILDPALAEQAVISLVPTEAARPINRNTETRGMVLLAAYRAQDSDRVLLAGRLLNRNLEFIDTMNALVYRESDGVGARTGTATLFLDDVRVSTNVRLFEGSRALGTRVSEVVWQAVMGRGETWLDSAFVVNDWYISGYMPVEDATGARIGMLYTGFLEQPFKDQRDATILWMTLAFMAILIATVPVFLFLARGVFQPLEQMTGTMKRVEDGELKARIGTVAARDEIGEVARHLDRLLDQVQERDEALRGYADHLNELVDQRTAELQEANRKLEATFAQLVISEKLASVGEITAGVAHEINNPVAVIQGNLDVLRQELGPRAVEHKAELDLVDAQIYRINVIVNKLLNFTRQGEVAEAIELVDPEVAIADSLVLVAADMRKKRLEIARDHQAAPQISIVATELQQVLVNLMLNAAQAMEEGGALTLSTSAGARDGKDGAVIRVRDTGGGIAPEKLAHVFDPFFTTKPAEGTGLGLSISQALINRAGGIITVESEIGVGSEFIIWLPAADISGI